jgi:hypothetical protein
MSKLPLTFVAISLWLQILPPLLCLGDPQEVGRICRMRALAGEQGSE